MINVIADGPQHGLSGEEGKNPNHTRIDAHVDQRDDRGGPAMSGRPRKANQIERESGGVDLIEQDLMLLIGKAHFDSDRGVHGDENATGDEEEPFAEVGAR